MSREEKLEREFSTAFADKFGKGVEKTYFHFFCFMAEQAGRQGDEVISFAKREVRRFRDWGGGNTWRKAIHWWVMIRGKKVTK